MRSFQKKSLLIFVFITALAVVLMPDYQKDGAYILDTTTNIV